MWFGKILRWAFILIDSVVYWAANLMYQLFILISETGVFSPSAIRTFAGRIYVLLGVFMMFKVTFSIITYILNPDDLTDKSKGLNKLVTNFFVVLIGIIAVPYVFQAAYSLQSIVLKDNIIGSLIMGMNPNLSTSSGSSYVERGGKLMSYTVLSGFITLNEDLVGEECARQPVVGTNSGGKMTAQLNSACTGNSAAMSALRMDTTSGQTVEQVLISAYEDSNYNALLTSGITSLTTNTSGGGETWVFDYHFIISTLAGGFLAWVLLIFCVDIATRSVKLSFLQLIAPIPIISYIDPKNGKDGMFKKWTNQCFRTYADLFIRLVAIYFVVFMISAIVGGELYSITRPGTSINIFVKIFIIFGALMFAKQLPDLVTDITGIKLDAGFTLNPMNKLQQIPLVGWGATQAAGRVAGAAESVYHDQTGHKFRAALSGWSSAGNALHGKVPLMGGKGGASSVRAIHTGREAGYEAATGHKMKAHIPFADYYRKKGEEEIKELKSKVRAPLQQEQSRIGLEKQETANMYKALNEKWQAASTPEEKASIHKAMQEAQLRYQELSAAEGKIIGDIATVNDQIKDLERAYSIDKSPADELKDIRKKLAEGPAYDADVREMPKMPTPGSSSAPTPGPTGGPTGGSTGGPTT